MELRLQHNQLQTNASKKSNKRSWSPKKSQIYDFQEKLFGLRKSHLNYILPAYEK